MKYHDPTTPPVTDRDYAIHYAHQWLALTHGRVECPALDLTDGVLTVPEGADWITWEFVTRLQRGLGCKVTVGGELDLNGTQIVELPADLTVGRSLNLNGTPIRGLPADLTVGRSLYLSGTPIRALPAGLTVGGSLYLMGTQIRSLPAGMTVGGWLWTPWGEFKSVEAARRLEPS